MQLEAEVAELLIETVTQEVKRRGALGNKRHASRLEAAIHQQETGAKPGFLPDKLLTSVSSGRRRVGRSRSVRDVSGDRRQEMAEESQKGRGMCSTWKAFCVRTLRGSPGCCVAAHVIGRSHQISGWNLPGCSGDATLMPAGVWAVGRPVAPPEHCNWGQRSVWRGITPKYHLTAARDRDVYGTAYSCTSRSTITAGVAFGASGLSSSGQKKGCDILEAARLCGEVSQIGSQNTLVSGLGTIEFVFSPSDCLVLKMGRVLQLGM